jgi:hypothetical protein
MAAAHFLGPEGPPQCLPEEKPWEPLSPDPTETSTGTMATSKMAGIAISSAARTHLLLQSGRIKW